MSDLYEKRKEFLGLDEEDKHTLDMLLNGKEEKPAQPAKEEKKKKHVKKLLKAIAKLL